MQAALPRFTALFVKTGLFANKAPEDPQRKEVMFMETKKCLNCGAVLELSKYKTSLECPYCGSKYDIETDVREKIEQKANDFNEDIFRVERDFTEDRSKKQTGRCIDTLFYCMNELGTPEKIENHIRKSLLNNGDIAAEGINDSLINNVKGRIDSETEPGEHIIVYKDLGIFSKGKEFVVVTEKRLLFFTKKKCKSILYKDIDTLRLNDSGDYSAWYINGDIDKRIPSMDPSGQLTGAVVAISCLKAFEQDPGHERIRLI